MKPGDLVTLRHGRVSIQLLSDYLEKTIDMKKALVGNLNDTRSLRRGDTAVVVEVSDKNLARVKIFYQSSMWWANVSDMVVVQ